MEKHDAHVNALSDYLMYKMLGGKTIHEYKQDQVKKQLDLKHAWANEYPQKNDRVIFRSVDKAGNIYDGCGYVHKVHIHNYRTGYALYTVKLEDIWDDEKDTYQLYSNHPEHADKEWIRRA